MAKSKGEPRGRRCELPLLLRRIEEWDESDRDARSSSEVSSSTEPSLRGRLPPLRFEPAARPVRTFPPLQPVFPRLPFLLCRPLLLVLLLLLLLLLPSEKLYESFLPLGMGPPAVPVDRGEEVVATTATAVGLPRAGGLAGVLAYAPCLPAEALPSPA